MIVDGGAVVPWAAARHWQLCAERAEQALDAERERNVKLERVALAAHNYIEMGSEIISAEYRELLAALTAARPVDTP